jgi:hypothetical protein
LLDCPSSAATWPRSPGFADDPGRPSLVVPGDMAKTWFGPHQVLNRIGHEPECGVSLRGVMIPVRRRKAFHRADLSFVVKGSSMSTAGAAVDAFPPTSALESPDSALCAHPLAYGDA